jgi:hypothetical protein
MNQDTQCLTNQISDLSLSISMLLNACQGAGEEERTLELDEYDVLLMDAGSIFLEDVLEVFSFLAGKGSCAPEEDKLVAFIWVVQALIKDPGKKGYPRAACGIEEYFRSLLDTLCRIRRHGAGGVGGESITVAQQFFIELANSLPGEVVEEKARVIVQIPDDMIRGLKRAAQENGVTVSKLVAQAIVDRIERNNSSHSEKCFPGRIPRDSPGEQTLHKGSWAATIMSGWHDRIEEKQGRMRDHG